MHSISKIAVAAALVSLATAGDAPVAQATGIGTTYSATIPAKVNSLSGAILGSIAPDGAGTNFQISFYNLPGSGNLSYSLHVDRVSNNDCSTAGAVLDPYGGFTGPKCATDMAGCQVGDLSDKHGAATILSGGSGTGYFPANYVDKYVSMDPKSAAFFGKGSFVVNDETGAAIACANFVNAANVKSNTTMTAGSSSTMATQHSTGTGSANNQNSKSSSTSSGFAVRTAAPVVGAGVLGLAAMFL